MKNLVRGIIGLVALAVFTLAFISIISTAKLMMHRETTNIITTVYKKGLIAEILLKTGVAVGAFGFFVIMLVDMISNEHNRNDLVAPIVAVAVGVIAMVIMVIAFSKAGDTISALKKLIKTTSESELMHGKDGVRYLKANYDYLSVITSYLTNIIIFGCGPILYAINRISK